MDMTLFSVIISILWVSIFIKALSLLRKQMFLLRYFSIYPLLFLLGICFLRLIFSFELPYTEVIESPKLLPAIQEKLCSPLINVGNGLFTLTPIAIISIVWIVVAVIHLIVKLAKYVYMRYLLSLVPDCNSTRIHSVLAEVQKHGYKHAQKEYVKIVIHEEVKSPAVAGFFLPIIMLPNIEFTDEELFGILTHEWMHYQHRHAFVKLIGQIFQSIFWWNPMFKQLNTEVVNALELHSDKMVCKRLTNKQQHLYLSAIIKVVNNLNDKKVNVLTCGLVEKRENDVLLQRFQMILEDNYSPKKNINNILTIPIICALYFGSYMFVIQPYIAPPNVDINVGYTIPQDAYIIETDGTYIIYDSDNNFISYAGVLEGNLKNLKIIKEETP